MGGSDSESTVEQYNLIGPAEVEAVAAAAAAAVAD